MIGPPTFRAWGATDVASACSNADLVVLATEWQEYRDLDWSRLRTTVAHPFLFDGRNALDAELLERAGWEVARIGQPYAPRPTSEPVAALAVSG